MKQYDVTDLTDAFARESDAAPRSELSSMAEFDAEAYRPYLEGLDLTDAQADELMRIVWNMMRMFVEMNLPVDSCGQFVESLIDPNQAGPDSLE